jgi:Haemolymph juvenile hormone binding protein (JHBP)
MMTVHKKLNTLLIPYSKGIPSLGVEPLDPLFVQKINVEQGAGAVTILLSLLNSTLTGLNNVKVVKQMCEKSQNPC